MKRIVILVLLFPYLAIYSQAVYNRFLEDGKVWNYTSNNYFTGSHYNFKLFLEGDTVIHDVVYKKVYQDDLSNYQYALCEKDNAIYIYDQWCDKRPRLLYDFSLNIGDVIEGFQVSAIDTIEVGDYLYRRFQLGISTDYVKEITFWVEGIGGLFNLEVPYPRTGNTVSFVSCELNGNVIFNGSDFSAISKLGVQKTIVQKVQDPFFDLQGRRLSGKPAKGVYIENGRKRIK